LWSSFMMRIVIVGAGISGLSTYLFFKKLLPSSYDISIYESHRLPKRSTTSDDCAANERPETIGAGLGVSPNGMRVLRHLDPEIYDAVVAQGYPVTEFNMRNARNWSLGCYPAKGGRDMEEKTVMSSRQGVWDCLREKVPGDAILVGKSVELVKRKGAGKMVLTFRDGQESEEVDLVIGADGVKSAVRKAVLGDGSADSFSPNYE
ncbi:MAG: hypothetical protein M1835_001863, partial [Candelina submexicana]